MHKLLVHVVPIRIEYIRVCSLYEMDRFHILLVKFSYSESSSVQFKSVDEDNYQKSVSVKFSFLAVYLT